jgi:carbon starvation protein
MREDRLSWLILFLIGVFSLWYPASGRTNNPLWLLLGAGCLFVLAYQLYGRFIFSRLLGGSPESRGAEEQRSGGERENALAPLLPLSPAPPPIWLAFAYQFAAIAGAGVLLGPVLASQFGWLPGVLWLILGAALAGAVQDMVILAVAVRRDQGSLTALLAEAAGPLAASTTWLLALAVLVLVLTTVGGALADVLAADAGAAYVLALTVPAALLVALHERARPGRGAETALVGLVLFVLALLAGVWLASRGPAPSWLQNRTTMVWLLAAYVAIAAVLPLPVLSRPRVAFSGLLALAGAALLIVLLMVAAPTMHIQPTTQFLQGGGPLSPGAAFPMLGLLLALGAISGFNALVASGLTGRLVRRASEALPVGYGTMLVAAFLALAALVTAATIWPGDLVAMITNIAPADVQRLTSLPVRELDRLNQLTKTSLPGQGGAAALAAGAAQAFAIFPGVRPVWSPIAYRLALALQALLLLAGLEAAGRLGRLALEEAGDALRRFLQSVGSDDFSRRLWVRLDQKTTEVVTTNAWLGAAIASAVVALGWGGVLVVGYGGAGSGAVSLLGLAALLLAAVALALGSVLIVWEKVGRQRLWVLATALPLIAVLVFSLAGGVVLAREAWRNNSGKVAATGAYTSLPTLAAKSKLLPVDRAQGMVRNLSADQAAEIYLAQGASGLAKALASRFGGPPEENTRIAQAIGREAARLLWGARLQLASVVLLVLLALAAVIATLWRGLAGPRPPAAPPPPPPPDDRWLGMNI